MIDRLYDYFSTLIPLNIDRNARYRALLSIFLFASLSTVAIHLSLPMEEPLLETLLHAGVVGLTYCLSMALLAPLLYRIRSTTAVHVWQIWLVSLIGFAFGYFLLPLSEVVQWTFGTEPNEHGEIVQFWQLLPVWGLVTYLFIQPYINEQLRQRLASFSDNVAAPNSELIHFDNGRNSFELSAAQIRNIVVEDHYCYVHFFDGVDYKKRDVAQPLRELAALLPAQFLQVHRSHIVNAHQIEEVVQRGRQMTLVLRGSAKVPVSRHRMREILPVVSSS